MFQVGTWNTYPLIFDEKVTAQQLLSDSEKFIIFLKQATHVNKIKALVHSESGDIVYGKFFNQKSDMFSYTLGEWNGVRVLCHIDDIEMCETGTFNMEGQLFILRPHS